MTGLEVFPALTADDRTTPVDAELAGELSPPAFEAVSCTRIVWATSAAVRVYVWFVAFAIATHDWPEPSQSSPW
jgi:hypothetical protein